VTEGEEEAGGSRGGQVKMVFGVAIDFLILAILRTNVFGERTPCRNGAPSG